MADRSRQAAPDRYPAWLRQAMYEQAITRNILPPQGVYARPAIRPAPFYTPYGIQFVFDTFYNGYTVARVGRDVAMAKGFVDNMVDTAVTSGPDRGMLRRSVTPTGDQGDQDGSQPQMHAWLARELHRLEPDREFLARVYPGLAAAVDWWQSPRRDIDGDGLIEAAGTTPTYAAYETGHDYSPERDLVMGEPTPAGPDENVHEPIADVFLNSCVVSELRALADIAAEVDPARVGEWTDRREAMAARMREAMWDEHVGAFFPVVRRDLVPEQPRVHRHTPAMLLPLWAGVATREQAARTVDTLLGRGRDRAGYDGEMVVEVDPALYHGYRVVTDGLHPSASAGAAAGGVELLATGLRCRFHAGRQPTLTPFARMSVEVEVADAAGAADVQVTVVDGQGRVHRPVDGALRDGVTASGSVVDAGDGAGDWLPGVKEITATATGARIRRLAVRYSRTDRAGLLTDAGVRSAHPLDGKVPRSGLPTQFWSGTVWGPHNFHACYGLRQYGYEALARTVARAYADGVTDSFIASGEAFEHFDPDTRRGLGTTDYGWLCGIALVLMEDFLDVEPLEVPA